MTFDLSGTHIRDEALQGRAVGIAAREAAIAILGPDQRPAGVGLAPDVGPTGVILGIERVEVLFETLVGRHPGIDRATHRPA
jgi:hypothetical protein